MNQLLSFVIPSYNEENTILEILSKVQNLRLPHNYKKEIIVVSDGSIDNTSEIVTDFAKKHKNVTLLENTVNLGKTQTVKKGILASSGNYVIIQDADLEYSPDDVVHMLDIAIEKDYDVVYGDRFGGKNGVLYLSFYLGNKLVTTFSNLFTIWRIRKWIPDMEVGYKLVKGDILRSLASNIKSTSNLGFEPEITALLAKYKSKKMKNMRWGLYDISYFPRTVEEGKKIRYLDGIKAIIEIIRFNI
jgi:dolichol-phosphate mannosyltransferase